MYITVKYIAIIFLCIAPILSYSEPHQYKAVYSFSLKGIEFANSEHNLTYDKNIDEWCINTISYTVNIFSLKEDTRTENSCFTFHKTNNTDLNIPLLNGYLGFKNYGDEYKVMGLAGFGKNKYNIFLLKILKFIYLKVFSQSN